MPAASNLYAGALPVLVFSQFTNRAASNQLMLVAGLSGPRVSFVMPSPPKAFTFDHLLGNFVFADSIRVGHASCGVGTASSVRRISRIADCCELDLKRARPAAEDVGAGDWQRCVRERSNKQDGQQPIQENSLQGKGFVESIA